MHMAKRWALDWTVDWNPSWLSCPVPYQEEGPTGALAPGAKFYAATYPETKIRLFWSFYLYIQALREGCKGADCLRASYSTDPQIVRALFLRISQNALNVLIPNETLFGA